MAVEAPRAREPFAVDEHPRATTMEQLGELKPVFQAGGTVTAGNSSGINDGAAAVMLMRLSHARERALAPRLLLRAWAVTGIEPEIMGYAPAAAIPKALGLAGVTLGDIDVIELNEAFAAQAVAVAEAVELPAEKLNPDGGAIALGHPVGATGAILTVKLMHALERTAGRLRARLDVHRRRPGLRGRLRAPLTSVLSRKFAAAIAPSGRPGRDPASCSG